MRSGIIKTNYENTYVFPVTSWNTLQFGGTGNDGLDDINILSTGDYLVSGYTYSTTFAGVNVADYIPGYDGSYKVWFWAKIDPSLNPATYLKGIYFLTGKVGADTYSVGRGYGENRKTVIDASDNFYFLYGKEIVGDQTGWKVYKRRTSDMTYVGQSALNPGDTVRDSTACIVYDSALNKIVTVDSGISIYTGRFNRFSTTPAFEAENVIDYSYPVDLLMNSTAYWLMDVRNDKIKKWNRDWVSGQMAEVAFSTLGIHHTVEEYRARLALDASYIYIHGGKAGNNDLRIVARNQSDLGAKAGFTPYEKVIDAGKYHYYNGSEVYNGNLYLIGSNDSGGDLIGTNDPAVIILNATTGAAVYDGRVLYADSSPVAQAGKYYTLSRIKNIGTNQFIVVGYTSGNLTGFSNLGNSDCIMFKMDNTGKIIA